MGTQWLYVYRGLTVSYSNLNDWFSGGSKPNSEMKHKVGGGLSCLTSATTDEDPTPVPKSSPEKRSLLSPSVNSISEIFAKSASSKFTAASSSKKDDKGVSPFAARKTEVAGTISLHVS